jgi:hypothetical protein
MSDSEQLAIYQLQIVILGISPMIWRRGKIRSGSTIADLRYIIQIAMGLYTARYLVSYILNAIDYFTARAKNSQLVALTH